MSSSSPRRQSRIFLWAVPRSISTAFFRAMMNKSSCKVLLEPYSRAYYFGHERVSQRYASEPVHEGCTYKDVKTMCEDSYSDYDTVFVKDMAYYLVNRLESPEYVPDNYTHAFLLRDPHKSVYSLYKMSHNKELTGWDHFDASEIGFKELYDMYRIVTEKLGQEAIVIDADDLLKHPETTFRLFCDKVGTTFEERMLKWEDTPQDLAVFQDWMPWFEGVLTTNTFQPSATKPKSPMVMPDLPRHVLKAIEENMVYYNKMYPLRLKPSTLQIQ